MLDKVIVGIDGGDEGRSAIALARSLAPTAEIVLVHAHPFESALSRALVLGYGERLRDDARHYMRHVATEAGLDPRCAEVCSDTSPARALHHAAERHRARLVVVGSAHRGRVGRVLLGDVSRSTLQIAPCPVAVAPPGFDGRAPQVVGVGYDGSPEADAALRFAAELAAGAGARVSVLTAVDVIWPAWSTPASEADAGEVERRLLRDARERAQAATSQLAVPADIRAVAGAVPTELAALADHCDVIVVGSRGYGPARRTVLGSTADRLMHNASCPVVVVPRGVAENGNAVQSTATAVTAPN